MVTKLFVVGTPGCGKSAVVRELIEPMLRDLQLSFIHFNDYDFLKEMFLKDAQKVEEERRFKTDGHEGFIVLDFDTFDEALQLLKIEIEEEISRQSQLCPYPPFVIIEFSRNDYKRAFQQFGTKFLEDAWFIYLDTSIANCKQRIRERIEKPTNHKTIDDYYVSDAIFETYYDYEAGPPLLDTLKQLDIDPQRGLAALNNGSLKEVSLSISQFIAFILTRDPSSEWQPTQDSPSEELQEELIQTA